MMGMNPRQMQKMMARMGMQQQEIDATEVIIRTKDKEYLFSEPSVSKVNAMGQQTWQIMGNFEERSLEQFSVEDVKTVMDQANASEEAAREALKESKGDLAEAILALKKE